MEVIRGKFQGVLNILSFNRHFYIIGGAVLSLLLLVWLLGVGNNLLMGMVLLAFAYGFLMPLIVSAYVYDFSGYYKLNWLEELQLTDTADSVNLNINAGFDETSYLIKKVLPQATLQVYDFYNPIQHTEPAIVRARKVSMVYPNTQEISTNCIPQESGSVDHVFLLSAAHEIRNHNEKVAFLKECKRVCKPNAKVIMVEHLRDVPNFMAFTIGFTHFFSAATWVSAFKEAGFSQIQEQKFTPFMSIFICN